jgi:hypothetical protein
MKTMMKRLQTTLKKIAKGMIVMEAFNDTIFDGYPNYTFCNVFPSFEDFKTDYDELDSSLKVVSEQSLKTIYFLLYAQYGNSHISNFDTEQFKYRLFSIIFMYGPIWQKKLEIQNAIRNLSLTDEEIFKGTKAIYNHAYNPSTVPSTATLQELETIDDQNTTNYKYSKLDGYAKLYDLISDDITKRFIDKFKNLFIIICSRVTEPIYESEE